MEKVYPFLAFTVFLEKERKTWISYNHKEECVTLHIMLAAKTILLVMLFCTVLTRAILILYYKIYQ